MKNKFLIAIIVPLFISGCLNSDEPKVVFKPKVVPKPEPKVVSRDDIIDLCDMASSDPDRSGLDRQFAEQFNVTEKQAEAMVGGLSLARVANAMDQFKVEYNRSFGFSGRTKRDKTWEQNCKRYVREALAEIQ